VKRFLLLGAGATLALLFVAWARGTGGASPASLESPQGRTISPTPSPTDDRLPAVGVSRNVFEYGGDARPTRSAPATEAHPAPTPAPVVDSPRDPVRLVGVLRRSGEVRAALAILGEVVILAPGETASGYTLIAIDEDTGARLRVPSGAEIVAPPAP
jgi:hypothetical protein